MSSYPIGCKRLFSYYGGLGDTVLYISWNNGSDWTEVRRDSSPTEPDTLLTYDWTVAEPVAAQCKAKVVDEYDDEESNLEDFEVSAALSATVTIGAALSGTLTGSGALTGTSTIGAVPTGTLTGSGALTGTATIGATPTGTLIGSGALTGTTTIGAALAGALTGSGALTGTSTFSLSLAGTLDGIPEGGMAGTAIIGISATGTLTGTGALTGTTIIGAIPTGTLTGSGALTGATTLSLGLAGTLTGSSGGGGLSTQEHDWLEYIYDSMVILRTQVDELHQIAGLKSGSPMTATKTARTVGSIALALTGDGTNTTTVTRT